MGRAGAELAILLLLGLGLAGILAWSSVFGAGGLISFFCTLSKDKKQEEKEKQEKQHNT